MKAKNLSEHNPPRLAHLHDTMLALDKARRASCYKSMRCATPCCAMPYNTRCVGMGGTANHILHAMLNDRVVYRCNPCCDVCSSSSCLTKKIVHAINNNFKPLRTYPKQQKTTRT
eukprot:4632383-Prorocentrum_lima.AAC.1